MHLDKFPLGILLLGTFFSSWNTFLELTPKEWATLRAENWLKGMVKCVNAGMQLGRDAKSFCATQTSGSTLLSALWCKILFLNVSDFRCRKWDKIGMQECKWGPHCGEHFIWKWVSPNCPYLLQLQHEPIDWSRAAYYGFSCSMPMPSVFV